MKERNNSTDTSKLNSKGAKPSCGLSSHNTSQQLGEFIFEPLCPPSSAKERLEFLLPRLNECV